MLLASFADSRWTVGRQATGSRRTGGGQPVDSRLTVGRMSVGSVWTVGGLWVDSRPTGGGQSVDSEFKSASGSQPWLPDCRLDFPQTMFYINQLMRVYHHAGYSACPLYRDRTEGPRPSSIKFQNRLQAMCVWVITLTLILGTLHEEQLR